MSYILDALKKSENERYHERNPSRDGIGQPIWLKAQKKSSFWPWVIVAAFLLNLTVIALLLWDRSPQSVPVESSAVEPLPAPMPIQEPAPVAKPVVEPARPAAEPAVSPEPYPEPAMAPEEGPFMGAGLRERREGPVSPDRFGQAAQPEARASASVALPQERVGQPVGKPMKVEPVEVASPSATDEATTESFPTIDELPPAVQQRIPALTFSSHIYSPDPESRRIMINNRYLREGQSVQGLRVVEVTTEGVVLSSQGQVFRIPVLRDWSPDAR